MSDLKRFIDAQRRDYGTALQEIQFGRKSSHWMWYIFPQIQGLGFSSTSKYYAVHDLKEAQDYLNDPYLNHNLVTICEALLFLDTSDAYKVFSSPDDMKLRSSMTLFEAAADKAGRTDEKEIFAKVLDRFFRGERDQRTIDILQP